ncbi:MAG: hypothetical protein JO042_15165 [Sinobacteraceae bacterium]|nr:hypothetical protein [Nevskiaceae bacterium]
MSPVTDQAAAMKAFVFWGAATGLFASLVVCLVSGRLVFPTPSFEEMPESVRPKLGVPLPGRQVSPAVLQQRSSASAFPLSPSREEQSWRLKLEIERALVSLDDAQRDRSYMQLLPVLIRIDPSAMKRVVERCPAGPVREELLRHTARTWSSIDLDAAMEWATAMQDDGERVIAATEIVSQVGQADPGHAIQVADLLGVGRDDGTVDHIAQLWAVEELSAAQKRQPTAIDSH